MIEMTDERAAEVLAAHNAWRRGGDGQATDPTTLGLALDHAIARLREPAGVGAFDAAVAAELSRVSHIEYNSHEICKHFAAKVRERIASAPRSRNENRND